MVLSHPAQGHCQSNQSKALLLAHVCGVINQSVIPHPEVRKSTCQNKSPTDITEVYVYKPSLLDQC